MIQDGDGKAVRNLGHLALKLEYYWLSVSFILRSGEFRFLLIYTCLSLQGLFTSPIFYSFHLLDMINRFPTLNNVIRSVTVNGNQLLMTAMLGVLILYLYSLFAYFYIADQYHDDNIERWINNERGQSVCMDMLHCFLSTFNYGLRMGGGLGDFLAT